MAVGVEIDSVVGSDSEEEPWSDELPERENGGRKEERKEEMKEERRWRSSR